MAVPYFHFKRKLTQQETYTEWSDNRWLINGIRAVTEGDIKTWNKVKDFFEITRVADLGEPGEERLNFIRNLINKIDENKTLLKNSKSLSSFVTFFTSTAGEDLIDGSMTNADGGKQNRICIERYLESYVNNAILGNKEDMFTASPEHLTWKKIGRKYTDFKELYGKFYDIVKVKEKGQLKDFCIFAKFNYNTFTKKMSRFIEEPEQNL